MKTRAVIRLDFTVCPPAIRAIAEKFNLHVIKDAAQSLGGKDSGKMSGSAADIAAFSFHGTKTLTTGEGGMFVTDNEAVFERAQLLRDHRRSQANYKNPMNSLPAFAVLPDLLPHVIPHTVIASSGLGSKFNRDRNICQNECCTH